MARPSKLTPGVVKRLLTAIADGNHVQTACAFAGVESSTVRKWLIKGRMAKSGEFFTFFTAYREAEIKAEITIVEQWRAMIPRDWRAARDFLARRFPKRWSSTKKLEHSGPDGGAIPTRNVNEPDLSALTKEELLAIRDLHTRLNGASLPASGNGQPPVGGNGPF